MNARRAEYRQYLQSSHWLRLRKVVLERDGFKCVRCPSRQRLQAHHTFYRRRFEDSQPEDLITMCRACHRLEHGIVVSHQKLKSKRNAQRNRIKHGFKLSKKQLKKRASRWQYEVRRGNWSF